MDSKTLGTECASATGPLCGTAQHLSQGSWCQLKCRDSKLVSPALDQKEADRFLGSGIGQKEKCWVCVEMHGKVQGTVIVQGSCLALPDNSRLA